MSKTKRKKKLEGRKVGTEEVKTDLVPQTYCKDCKKYQRITAKCTYHDIFVARKNTCDNWEKK